MKGWGGGWTWRVKSGNVFTIRLRVSVREIREACCHQSSGDLKLQHWYSGELRACASTRRVTWWRAARPLSHSLHWISRQVHCLVKLPKELKVWATGASLTGAQRNLLHAFYTSAIDTSILSASRSDCFIPTDRNLGTYWLGGLDGTLKWSGQRDPTCSSLTINFTDWAIIFYKKAKGEVFPPCV